MSFVERPANTRLLDEKATAFFVEGNLKNILKKSNRGSTAILCHFHLYSLIISLQEPLYTNGQGCQALSSAVARIQQRESEQSTRYQGNHCSFHYAQPVTEHEQGLHRQTEPSRHNPLPHPEVIHPWYTASSRGGFQS